MAANKFATLIHRKTNRFTLILIYAFLEWILIFFILLNSLFSYFILKLADYFGLKRPCLFCSRLDRFFDASGKSPSYKDLLCDDHALEISDSKPVESRFSSDEIKTNSSDFAPIEDDFGMWNFIGDDVQIHNGRLFTEQSRSIFVLEEGNLGSVNLIDSQEEEETEKKLGEQRNEEDNTVIEDLLQSPEKVQEEDEFSCFVSSFDCNKEVTVENEEEEEEEAKVDLAMESKASDEKPVESTPKNLEFYIDNEDCHLIPVEFYKQNEEIREISDINGDFILDFGAEPEFAAEKERLGFSDEISASASPDESKPADTETNLDDILQLQNDEEQDADVFIGTEIPDHDQIGDFSSHEVIHNEDDDDNHEEDTLEFKTPTIEIRRPIFNEEHLLESRGHSVESPEGVLTIDKLKSELQEERKALTVLYEELEEERSASAIAANETMAMINRLHEEKAAMQMEALQYQRMMEEQSEFDQEALEILNELIVKREKENVELEKEIEVYRKRLEEYEVKEKLGILSRRIRDSSVDSYRNNGGDSNEKEMENTPADVVLRLDECLDDYEGERLSILERLKFLEDKLSSLEDDTAEEEVKTVENNGSSVNGNGHYHLKETNGKYRNIKSKRLLPLFNAVDGEMENGYTVEESENGEVVTVEEEVNELYERLEALEADREFLRHCVGSLKKGDKGVNLLHEILQNLRDLRNIDLVHVRDNEDMSF